MQENIQMVSALINAHKKACHRGNASSQILKASFQMNGGDLIKSITCALQVFGGRHAPIKQTYSFLYDCLDCVGERERLLYINKYIQHNKIVPGFGSGFIKKQPDPLLEELRLIFEGTFYDEIANTVTFKSDLFGKKLYPNLSFYTASVAIFNDIPIEFCEKYLLERIPEWIKILQS